MFERILVPLDGSPRAEVILSQVGRLLKREDAEVILFRSVYRPPALARMDVGTTLREEREQAQTYVHDLARRLADQGIKVHGRVAQGMAAPAILEAAEREGATMIAMTTHGHTGLLRWTLGSVAEKVVRAASIPVFLVRSFRRTPKGDLEPVPSVETPFRRILVPVDGSATSMAAVPVAREFGLLFGSRITVLHVVLPYVTLGPILPGMEATVPYFPPPSEDDPVTDRAARRFEQAGLDVSRVTIGGDPSLTIVDHPFAPDVDLIALATHGRSGLSRWMMGSVAERVVRHAEVPLLIVRAPEAKAKGGRKKARR